MPKVSYLREKIAKYINEHPLREGYSPKFFVNEEFTPDVNYCRALMMELAENKKLIKKRFKGLNGQMTYRFFSVGQFKKNTPIGMTNFVSPSIFFNNNQEPDIESVINSEPWKKFVRGTRIHQLMGESSKLFRRVVK